MKRMELFGYSVSAQPHPEEAGAKLLIMQSKATDSDGSPLEVILIGMMDEVAANLATQLMGGNHIETFQTLPKFNG